MLSSFGVLVLLTFVLIVQVSDTGDDAILCSSRLTKCIVNLKTHLCKL